MRILTVLIMLAGASAAALASAQRLPHGFYPESLAITSDGSLFAGSATRSEIVRVTPGAVQCAPFVAAGAGG